MRVIKFLFNLIGILFLLGCNHDVKRQDSIGLKKSLTTKEKEAQYVEDEKFKKAFNDAMKVRVQDMQRHPEKYRSYISGSDGKCFYTYYINDYGSRVYTKIDCH